MHKHLMDAFLEIALTQAAKDRDEVNTSGNSTTEEKRAVAHVYTKLKEAQMWMNEAPKFYQHK